MQKDNFFNHCLLRNLKEESDLYTNLDIDAQKSAAKFLGNRKGAVVAIDLDSGGINVLYSSPGYLNK